MLVLCSSNKACFRRCSCARRAALRISAQQETFPRQATTRRGRRRKSECCRAPAATAALTSLQTALGPVVAQDCITAVVAAGAAYVWVRFFDWMASRGLLSQVSSLAVQTDQIYDLRFEAVQNLSRKLVHISSGPLFVLTWPFFRCGHARPLAIPLLPGTIYTVFCCAVQNLQLNSVQL